MPDLAPPGDYQISTDPQRLDVAAIHAFLTQSYWSPGIPRATVERAISHSLCFGLYRGTEQAGFARVVTDRATFAYLADVFILEAHRGLYRQFAFDELANPSRMMEILRPDVYLQPPPRAA